MVRKSPRVSPCQLVSAWLTFWRAGEGTRALSFASDGLGRFMMVKGARCQSLSCLGSTQSSSVLQDESAAGSLSFDRLKTSDPSLESSGPCGSDGAGRDAIGPVLSMHHPDLCFQISQAPSTKTSPGLVPDRGDVFWRLLDEGTALRDGSQWHMKWRGTA